MPKAAILLLSVLAIFFIFMGICRYLFTPVFHLESVNPETQVLMNLLFWTSILLIAAVGAAGFGRLIYCVLYDPPSRRREYR